MPTKNKLAIPLVITLLIIAVLAVIKPYPASFTKNPPNTSSEDINAVQLELSYPYQAINLTDREKGEILRFIKAFETLQYEKKAEVLGMFTPPANKEEKEGLDFLEGKDIGSNSRLYGTAGFSWSLNWYMVRKL